MRIKFRGVRGSVPWSVPEGIVHGCNTPCIEIYDETTGGIVVLDAGSGIVGVNPSQLVKEPRPVSLLLTHYHWDHLLGLPFFSTLYQPGWDMTIYAPTLEVARPEVARHDFQIAVLSRALRSPAEQAERADGEPGKARPARIRNRVARPESPGRVPRVSDQGVVRRFGLRDRSRVRQSCLRRAARRLRQGGRRDDCSTRTSRPRSCRSTGAGGTATGGSAPSSPRQTASASSGCSITSPAERIRRWKTFGRRRGKSSPGPIPRAEETFFDI